MSIYLGDNGGVALQRSAVGAGRIAGELVVADVDVNARRWSFDFPTGAIITGDRIEIATQDGSDLELVDGHDEPDGNWFAHVDMAGGIRLYDSFEKAVNGGFTNAIALTKPSKNQFIYVRNRDENYNCVAQIQNYEITTSRETVDLTVLGENFRENYANGLITGQGTLNCLWEYDYRLCDVSTKYEVPHYFAQLILRLEQGSFFKGHFFVTKCDTPAVWYESDCVVTNVAFTFDPTQIIRTQIQFVTTGEIKLMIGELPSYLKLDSSTLRDAGDSLLQENNDLLELEIGDD